MILKFCTYYLGRKVLYCTYVATLRVILVHYTSILRTYDITYITLHVLLRRRKTFTCGFIVGIITRVTVMVQFGPYVDFGFKNTYVYCNYM